MGCYKLAKLPETYVQFYENKIMTTLGNLIEQTIEYGDRGLFELAFVPACETVRQTAEKLYQGEENAEPAFQRFLRENWRIISLLAITRDLQIPADIPLAVRQAIPGNAIVNSAEELVIYAVRQTLAMNRMPLALGFNKRGGTVVEGEKLLLPKSLIFAMLAAVIINPINKDETITDRYWLNMWDFKMFISELWGRNDILRRIIELYFPDGKL
jgi:hypothetical protein